MDEDDYAYSESELDYPQSSNEASVSYYSEDEAGQDTRDYSERKKAQYQILDSSALQSRQDAQITEAVSILGVSSEEAVRILRHYKWDYGRLNDEWWADMETVRQKVGMMEEDCGLTAPKAKAARAQCSICFDDYRVSQMQSAGCGHLFCHGCWKGYISAAIKGGHPVLGLRCPNPDCQIAVPGTVFQEICTEEESSRYEKLSLENFVVDNKRMTYCPGPNCKNAVESFSDLEGKPLDVYCPCGTVFCYTCKEEAHRPVDCETIKKWILKNSAESENLTWIIANTKPCPLCKRPIEKNQGCMHMTCSQCKHQFCWLCLQNWSTHDAGSGGYYACNRYEAAIKTGEINVEEQRRQNAKQALERYMHYYERWSENEKAKKEAVKKLDKMEDVLEELSQQYGVPTSELKYITDACLQVIDCRRILKWTYAFGYYNFDEFGGRTIEATALKQQKHFFEFNQGQAESHLDRLHAMVEQQLPVAKRTEAPETPQPEMTADDLNDFRVRLLGATELTKTHFHKLVEELEKGMDKMLTAYDYKPAAAVGTSKQEEEEVEVVDVAEPSKPAKKSSKSRGKAARTNSGMRTRATGRTADETVAVGIMAMDEETERSLGFWQCQACTFANPNLDATECEICEAPRVR